MNTATGLWFDPLSTHEYEGNTALQTAEMLYKGYHCFQWGILCSADSPIGKGIIHCSYAVFTMFMSYDIGILIPCLPVELIVYLHVYISCNTLWQD